ncbi:MAG: gliding motility-associated C-terminal domain-containing protein [Marinilabiliaceae bacterium]|nr:gliding motility-associated C-terminal domain-containing protein [Marinilabiliaceae bacterium]
MHAFSRLSSILITIALVVVDVSAQIVAPTAKAKQVVASDTVFYFQNFDDATLEIRCADKANISWYAFSPVSLLFDSLITTFSDTTHSAINIGIEGGYAATVATADTTFEYRVWCFASAIDSLKLSIDSIDCTDMKVAVKVFQHSDSIYNYNDAEYKQIKHSVTYDWYSCDTIQQTTSKPQATLATAIDDGYIKVVVKNEVGTEVSDSVYQESVGVLASFTTNIRDHEIENEVTSPTSYSAPVEVEFSNTSKGKYTVSEWAMGTIARMYETNPVYMFQTSGDYTVTLIVTNENSSLGCQSSDSSFTISVTEAEIGFPEAFTPNGDGVNDLFLPAYKSIKSYKISIMNRWGREVYKGTSPSEGWNGKINGQEAPAGTYFYIVDAEAYDKNVTFHKKGCVTLLR